MKLIPRIMATTIQKAIQTFPAVVVTGPRQSGKTTLFKMMFSDTHQFVSLENPDIRLRAQNDPVGFLAQHQAPVIIDEIQYVPDLLSYIKTKIDDNRKPGQWLLTGSQNFILMQGVSQSLAGRAAILNLMPFAFSESINQSHGINSINNLINMIVEIGEKSAERIKPNNMPTKKKISVENVLLKGFYPEIVCNSNVDRQLWCGSYLNTYVERDVRNIANVGDLNQFERFLRICAIRTGQILNLSEMARDIGISVPTAKRWLSILETGYQIFLLYPYYKNIGKRLVKSPKLYFNDTALCSYLLGINDKMTLLNGPSFPHLFETMIVCDFYKRFLNFGEKPSFYYLRTLDGFEIDLVIEIGGKIHLFEIKSGATIVPKHAASLKRLTREKSRIVASASIISGSEDNFLIENNIYNFGWKNILLY